VERTTEKNYFFKLSAYTDRLLQFYRSHPDFVQPQTRFNEVLAFVEGGLKDLSISRTSIQWGIPFPGNPDHVIYVWLDALTNYISALGFGSADHARFDAFWPADVHLIGKDIVRFHAVYWPAFLMAAGVELPKSVVAHGWWLRDNQKISKSTGNIVRPNAIIDEFGPDAFRYFLLREMVFGQDSNYSDEAFVTRYNSDLANDYGNTFSRLMKMTDTYFGGKTPPIDCAVNEVRDAVEIQVPEYQKAMAGYAFHRALDATWKLLDAINQYIVTREPWKRFKEEGANAALSRILWDALEGFRIVTVMLHPFMPSVTADVLRRIGMGDEKLDKQSLWWGWLPTRAAVTVGDSLFPRIDSAVFLQQPATEKGAEVSSNEEAVKTAANPHPGESAPPAETTAAVAPTDNLISIDDFFRAELKVAQIKAAEKVEKSKKLMKLRVDTGDGERTIVAGIATKYSAEELVGRKVVIVANLQPAKLMGIESQGMVLAASIDGEPSLVTVDEGVPVGTKVK
jgi:methionyl-tRNA synthetase